MKKVEINRLTVGIDPKVYRGIIKLQAKIIRRTSHTCSFSETVTIVLEKGLKKMLKKYKKK